MEEAVSGLGKAKGGALASDGRESIMNEEILAMRGLFSFRET